MNSIGKWVAAMGIVASVGFHSQHSLAEGFTGKDFGGWSENSQNSYIQTSMTMAGIVLSRITPDKARCVDDWYGGEQKVQRNAFIRETIAKFDTYHPGGTILAIIEKQCGALK